MSSSLKPLRELTFADDFIFCKVLQNNTDICREFVEIILGRKIGRIVTINGQESIKLTADGKGVRFDVYFEDDSFTKYDIEMQRTDEKNILKRSRYYQGMIDLDQLDKGAKYKELKDSYIIFVSMFDPFYSGLCKYTVKSTCEEDRSVDCDDGTRRIFFNPCGSMEKLSNEAKVLLRYIVENLPSDDFTSRLDLVVRKSKQNKELEVEYMTLYERLQDEREEGVEEGKQKGKKKLLFALLKNGDITEEKAAKYLGMTVDELLDLLGTGDSLKS